MNDATIPVVLVHGLGSSFEHGWRPAGWIDLIADAGRPVVPVDILGHGTATRPHDPAAYGGLEASVAAALPDAPVDAIGFSLGAQLLLRLAAQSPNRFRRLVVIGAGANVFLGDGSAALADAFEHGPADDDIGARVFTSLAAEAGNDPLAISACLRRPSAPLTAEELATVTCPVLVILGDQDFAGPADPLVDALPDARLVTLRGIDHFQATRDFACIDAALEFIDAVPALPTRFLLQPVRQIRVLTPPAIFSNPIEIVGYCDWRRRVLPDFLIIGAPKAGTTAVHRALQPHPELFLSPVKEPKFFLCDGRPPRGQRGPGDAHSAQEWIWRRNEYEALFAPARPDTRRGESTPFYLASRAAHIRMAATVPDARLIVVVRDPVDRAYSNWMHAWSDGLEPIENFADACAAEPARIAEGWAPFWHYTNLGRYGEQLEHLFRHFPREQVHILRYMDLVDRPRSSLNDICAFLGVEQNVLAVAPPENSRPFVRPSLRARVLARSIRAGAAAGAHVRPEVWRLASKPLTTALQWNGTRRPALTVDDRRRLVEKFADDVRLLERLTGRSFESWVGDEGRGEFAKRWADSRSA